MATAFPPFASVAGLLRTPSRTRATRSSGVLRRRAMILIVPAIAISLGAAGAVAVQADHALVQQRDAAAAELTEQTARLQSLSFAVTELTARVADERAAAQKLEAKLASSDGFLE